MIYLPCLQRHDTSSNFLIALGLVAAMDATELDLEIICAFTAAYQKGWCWACALCVTMVVQHGSCASGVNREDVCWRDMVDAMTRIVTIMDR